MEDTAQKLLTIHQGTAITACPEHGIHVGHVFDLAQLAAFVESEKADALAAKPDIIVKTEVTIKGGKQQ